MGCPACRRAMNAVARRWREAERGQPAGGDIRARGSLSEFDSKRSFGSPKPRLIGCKIAVMAAN
jgi:hypothetical protein